VRARIGTGKLSKQQKRWIYLAQKLKPWIYLAQKLKPFLCNIEGFYIAASSNREDTKDKKQKNSPTEETSVITFENSHNSRI